MSSVHVALHMLVFSNSNFRLCMQPTATNESFRVVSFDTYNKGFALIIWKLSFITILKNRIYWFICCNVSYCLCFKTIQVYFHIIYTAIHCQLTTIVTNVVFFMIFQQYYFICSEICGLSSESLKELESYAC